MIGGMFGVWTHRKDINEEEQRFTRKEEFPEYVDFLKYMAKLYREGLVDPELFMTDQSVAISRQREARVGIGITWPNDIDVLEVAAQQVDPETRYNAFRMPRVEGLENTQYWQTLTLPNYCTLISAKAKDPERIMKFLDWQVSTEGWLCMCYGAPTTDVAQGCWYEEGDQYYYDQAARDEYTAKDPTYENQVLGGWTYMMAGRYVYHINHQGFANVTESPDKQRIARGVHGYRVGACPESAGRPCRCREVHRRGQGVQRRISEDHHGSQGRRRSADDVRRDD